MSIASRRGATVLAVALVLAVVPVVSAPAAGANAPGDLRVVWWGRSAASLDVVVAVPARLGRAAAVPGALSVVGADGRPQAATTSALPSASAAVAVVVHVAGATPEAAARAAGTAAELVRSLDPAVPVAVVTTAAAVVASPLGVDRSVALAALVPMVDPGVAPGALPAAVDAARTLLRAGSFVAPLIAVVDATGTVTAPPAADGMVVRVIPVAGGTVADPVALVDEAVGLTQHRFLVSVSDPGAAVTVVLRDGEAALAAPVVVSAGPVASVAAAATTRVPTVLAERAVPQPAPTPTVPAAVFASSSDDSRGWRIALLGMLALAGVGGATVLVARHRRATAADDDDEAEGYEPPAAPEAPAPLVAGFYYTDLTSSRPSPAEVYERRVQVLQLAEKLGNISEACRIVGVSRRSYYEWKRIADERGLDALRPKRARG